MAVCWRRKPEPRDPAPSGCVCALSRPRWERLSQSAILNGRIILNRIVAVRGSALRPAGQMQHMVHHITSMRGVAYKRQTQLHATQAPKPKPPNSLLSTVSQASSVEARGGSGAGGTIDHGFMASCEARRRSGALSRFVAPGILIIQLNVLITTRESEEQGTTVHVDSHDTRPDPARPSRTAVPYARSSAGILKRRKQRREARLPWHDWDRHSTLGG